MILTQILTACLLAAVAGSLAYCLLAVVAAVHYGRAKPPRLESTPPVSILMPLAGIDEGLEANLRSLFAQDYPHFEILFAVRRADDPAAKLAARLIAEFPQVPARLLVTGEPPYPNAKVFSLESMEAEARYELLVMNDSDTRARPDMLRVVAAEFQDARVGLATCPYRGVPGRGVWSVLEAIGMNTQFLAGVLVARMLEGMKFALGPSIVARRSLVRAMGGFGRLKEYLAEDFVMGKLAHELGFTVLLSSCRIEHHVGAADFAGNVSHRLRWARSTRRSRPKGYVGELFTHPLPLALFLWAWQPQFWPVLAAAAACRAASAMAVAGWVLRDPLTLRCWWAVPIQDLLGFVIWVLGFFGNQVTWRGRRYRLHRDGRFELSR